MTFSPLSLFSSRDLRDLATLRIDPRRGLLALFALASAGPVCASASGTLPNVGDRIATFEIELPSQDQFTLRGTLPLPPGVYLDGDSLTPLAVVNSAGLRYPTQVEIMTRYANAGVDGADVVEVLARVARPAGGQPGERVRYDVQYFPHAQGAFASTASVDQLIRRAGAVTMSTRDVFGHSYQLDLLEDIRTQSPDLRRTHRGELVRGWRSHGVLAPTQPSSGPTGTLPHMMGVHAYVKQWASESFLTLDLRVHNGLSGLDQSDPLDDAMRDVYFDQLDIRVPVGWHVLSAFVDPYLGGESVNGIWNTKPLIKAQSDGSLHLFRMQGQLFRRLVIVRDGHETDAMSELRCEHLAFCRAGTDLASGHMLWSWWNPGTARFAAQNHRLPSIEHVNPLPIMDQMDSDLTFFAQKVASGTGMNGAYPLILDGPGYTRPYGTPYGGMAGGVEVDLFGGIELAGVASRNGFRLAQLMCRMYIDRQPTSLFNLDGDPTSLNDWLRQSSSGPYFPGYFNHVPLLPHNDPFGFMSFSTFQTDAVVAQGLVPSYQGAMLSYKAIDIQHWTRYTRILKTLAWIGADPLAISEIEMNAELYRLSYNEYPNSAAGHVQDWGLLGARQSVDQNPNQGFGFGRASGWGLDMAASAYAFGTSDLRDRFYAWFGLISDLVEDGQSDCTFNLEAQPHHSNGAQYRIWQCFETAIGENALRAILETAFRGRSPQRVNQLGRVMVKQAYGTISPAFWTPGQTAPHGTVAVGPHDTDLPPYCGAATDEWASPELDSKYYWNSLAYAYEMTRDNSFLAAAAQMAGTSNLFNFFQNQATADIENRGMMLALMQQLHGIY